MSRSLQFDIVANDEATAKMKGVQNAAKGFASQLGKYFAGFASAQAIAGQVMATFQRAFEWGSGLKDSAAAVGLTVEEFQRLEYAASQTGVSIEKLQTGMRELRKTMRDASQGNAESARILLALGYSQEQIATNSIDAMDAFMRVSEAISAAKTEQEKFNIASAVFGDRVAQQMVAALGNFGELKRVISETPLITEREAELLDRAGDRLDYIAARIKVITAQTMLNPGGLFALFNPAAAGSMFLQGKIMDAATRPGKEPPPSQEAINRGKQVIDAGRKAGKGSAELAGGAAAGLLTAAAIGGAAGFRPSSRMAERTQETLDQIEANTRPAPDIPANGATDFTKPSSPSGKVRKTIGSAAGRVARAFGQALGKAL
jgi:hypothetical protein